MQECSRSSKQLTWRVTAFAAAMLLAALCLAAAPQQAHAITTSNGASAHALKENTTYKKWDVTGDGKADTIRISASGRIDGRDDTYAKVVVTVNGKKALSSSAFGYYGSLKAQIITLKNGKPFLYLYTPHRRDPASICAVFTYKSGKFKKVIDCNTFFGGKFGSELGGYVKKVSGNTVTMRFYAMSWMASFVHADYVYKYKSGTLKQDSRTGKLTVDLAKANTAKALRSMTAYKSASCTARKFTVKKGQSVKFLNVYVKGNAVRFQVKAGGKTGWIKCATSTSSSLLANNAYGKCSPFEGMIWNWRISANRDGGAST